MRPLLYLLLCAGVLSAQEHPKHSWRWWGASVVALAAATSADTAVSWHEQEDNGILGRRFGARAVAIKGGTLGAVSLGEWLILRSRPDIRKQVAVINLTGAGVYCGGVGYSAAH
jgi:hypothetical protein